MKTILKASLILAAVSYLNFGCKKDDNGGNNTSEQKTVELSSANTTSESLYDDVFSEVLQVNDQSGLNGPSGTEQIFGCATVTVNPQDAGVFPKTVTIDYGTSGCTVLGITRKGKIIYTITGKFRNSGSTLSVTFENYSVNNHKLEGTYSITNSTSGNTPSITTQVTNGKLTYPDGKYYTYSGTRTWLQSAGVGTTSILDDEFTITGSSNVASSEGNTLTATIKTGLLRKMTCLNVVSGTVEVVYNNIPGLLDFGTGECDKNATVKVANKTYDITLP
ncbi:MAG: hypothetical protein SFU87_14365 [Chitinophagaceae bacterium]|nr:hypothetical protein [Chitinophagaceae bacterium]